MPAKSPEAKRQREINRRARLAADPKAAAKRKAQLAAGKARYKATPKAKATIAAYKPIKNAATYETRRAARRIKRKLYDKQPFAGVDGEGIGRGPEHKYALFRIGTRELFKGNARLTTGDILAFILEHPAHEILVAFAFEYDITMIFARDVHPATIGEMLAAYEQTIEARPGGKRKAPYWTWIDTPDHGRFGVNWLPRNHLKICRPHPKKAGKGQGARTIYDSWGFFATSFLSAITHWGVGKRHQRKIKAMKAQRAAFDRITPEIAAYCALECDLLAELMEDFRAACIAAGIIPRTWNGSGKLASTMLKENGVITARELRQFIPPALTVMAQGAYYGGRFEITRAGRIDEPVNEDDINSAYPAAMLDMPCLRHGRWRRASAADLDAAMKRDDLFICPIKFTHPREQFLCGFPFRSAKDGRLSWPALGNGVYWSPEIRSAVALGATVSLRAGYRFERKCDCRPLAFMEAKFIERKKLEKAGGKLKADPIKRGMNSAYGKFAQRIGDPPFSNPLWAGLMTAITRAKLNHAIVKAGDQRRVIMIATDAIYTLGDPLDLDHGDGLGQWGHKTYPSLFVVQPGLYWPPKSDDWRVKSRGLSPKFFESRTHEFEAVWEAYRTNTENQAAFEEFLGPRPPSVAVTFPVFVGLRIAAHWGRPDMAGQWIEETRRISFDWAGKRGWHNWLGKAVILSCPSGESLAHSARYTPSGKLSTSDTFEIDRMLIEAMPEPLDLTPPHLFE
jgi:hypothetical protein